MIINCKNYSVRVISICSLEHKEVWKLTSNLLPEFVKADEYFVYVPEGEIKQFEEFTNSKIKILSQESLDVGFGKNLRYAIEKTTNASRFGWYLQQFYKIQALINSEKDISIIWDADCVPVKVFHFLDENEKLIYMYASEKHKDYFDAIKRLLKMDRVQDQSFVIPGFPFFKTWTKSFIRDVETVNGGINWYDAIIDTTNLDLLSGFSETETLGTWVANKQPNNWVSSTVNWERYGQSKFGFAKDFTPQSVVQLGEVQNLGIISFENWDIKRSNYNSIANFSGIRSLIRKIFS